MLFVFFSTLLSWLVTIVNSDISPNPNPYDITNKYGVPQGQVFLQGSIRYSWEEDEEGFTVIPSINRTYYYAMQDTTTGDLVATSLPIRKKVNGVLVGKSPLSLGIKRREQPSDTIKKQKCGDFCKNGKGHRRDLRNLVSTTGTLKNLMVLFKFSDHTSRTLPTVSDIMTLMNHPGDGVNIPYDALVPTGSVRYVYNYSESFQFRLTHHARQNIVFLESTTSRVLMVNCKLILLLPIGLQSTTLNCIAPTATKACPQ